MQDLTIWRGSGSILQINAASNEGTDENDGYVVYNYEQQIWYVGNLEHNMAYRGLNEFPMATTSETNTETPGKLCHGSVDDGVALAFIDLPS